MGSAPSRDGGVAGRVHSTGDLLEQQALRGLAPRGLQDEKLQQLKYDLHWCLTRNDWWFTGAGLVLGGALSWATGSMKPFAAAAVLAPAADWAYGRAACSEYEQAYSAYKKQKLQEYREQMQEVKAALQPRESH